MKRHPLKAAGPGEDNLRITLSRKVRTVSVFNTSGPYTSGLGGSAEEACFVSGEFLGFKVAESKILLFGDSLAYIAYEHWWNTHELKCVTSLNSWEAQVYGIPICTKV